MAGNTPYEALDMRSVTTAAYQSPFNQYLNTNSAGSGGGWKWLLRLLIAFSVFYVFVGVMMIKKITNDLPQAGFPGHVADFVKANLTSNGSIPDAMRANSGTDAGPHFDAKLATADTQQFEAEIKRLRSQLFEATRKLTNAQAAPKTPDAAVQQLKEELKMITAKYAEQSARLEQRKEPQKPIADSSPTGDGSIAFTRKVFFDKLPASSAWCYGTRPNRICRFKNLYFDGGAGEFFFVKKPHESVIVGLADVDFKSVLDLSTIEEHNAFFFSYVEVSDEKFTNVTVERAQAFTFILSRFHTGNNMHVIHDDLLGLFHLHKEYRPPASNAATTEEMHRTPFDKNNFIMFADGHDEGGYGHVFKYLTNYPLQFKVNMKSGVFQFPECVVGNSKMATWYHYGFLTPQGPIPNKQVNGEHVKQVANFITRQLGHEDLDLFLFKQIHDRFIEEALKEGMALRSSPSPPAAMTSDTHQPLISDEYYIVIFSRRHDRIILNETDLAAALTRRFKLPVKFVRNEDLQFPEQVAILRRAIVAVGVHGSLLIMGMFLPFGAILIELYPLAVPADNYTPYKTMCSLPGMFLSYRAWSNTHSANNISYPDRIAHYGGIKHLPPAEQEKILSTMTVPPHLCCSNPFWLFRIFQDTRAEIDEIIAKIVEAAPDARSQLSAALVYKPDLGMSIVTNGSCVLDPSLKQLRFSWDEPWNLPADYTYLVWSHEHFKEFTVASPRATNIVINDAEPTKEHQLWVKVFDKNTGKAGVYSRKFVCEVQKQ